jgi:hypothetical protein
MGKRQKGIATAVSKLTKEEQDFIDALNNDMFEEIEVQESKILDAHFEKQTPKVQNHLNNLLRRGHTYPEAVKKAPGATPLSMKENVDLEEAASTNTTHGYHGNVKVDDDSQRPKAFAKMHAKVKKLAHEGGHLEDAKKPNVMVRHFLDSAHGRHIANNPTDKEITSRFAHFAKSYNPAMHEEVELEEEKNLTGLPKSTAEKNKQYIEITHLLGHKRRVPVHPTNAFKALNRYRKDPSTKSARIVSEDIELEEGRGRPPKEGSAAWHAKQKQDNDDMPALGVQLRKAKSMNKKVRFMDGKEHEIAPHHVDKFEDHMAARKTSADKAAFQKQAHKSHAEFVKAVSASVPKSSKDTGEIVRYRH